MYESKVSVIKRRSVLGLDLIWGSCPIMGSNRIIGQPCGWASVYVGACWWRSALSDGSAGAAD